APFLTEKPRLFAVWHSVSQGDVENCNDLRYAHTLLHVPCYLFGAFPRSSSHFLDTLTAITNDPELELPRALENVTCQPQKIPKS
ncbi:hypothetical protein ALC57_18898, partial [Trachymyrmex cornetzi]